MDGDTDLVDALNLGCLPAVVRVRSAAHLKRGTRSETAVYEVDVVDALGAAIPTPLVLKHFGEPRLRPGGLGAVAIVDSRRHGSAWEVRFAAASSDDPTEAAAALRARVAHARSQPRGS